MQEGFLVHFNATDIKHHAIVIHLQAACNNKKLDMVIGKTRGIHAVYSTMW
jgi:hypothetical protein